MSLSKHAPSKRGLSNRTLDVQQEVAKALAQGRGVGSVPVTPAIATAAKASSPATATAPSLRRLRGKSALVAGSTSGSTSGGSSRPSLASPPMSSPVKPTGSAASTPMKSPELKKVKVKNEVPTPKKNLDENFGVVQAAPTPGESSTLPVTAAPHTGDTIRSMDTRSTLPRSATMEESQVNAEADTVTDTWTVRDTVRVMMFEDPAMLGPGRMLDLPAGLTENWVAELGKILPGPTEPHDLPGLRKLFGLEPNTGGTPDEFDEAAQQLILSYHDAAAARTAVLKLESDQLMKLETERKKGDAFMKQLDLLCEKGKLSIQERDAKRASVNAKLQDSKVALQNDVNGRVADKCDRELVCADAVLHFHQLIPNASDQDAPDPEPAQVNELTGDVEIDMEAFEEEFSAFLSISDPEQIPAPAVPCKVEHTFMCVPPRSEKPDLDRPIFEPLQVVIDDDDDEDVAVPQEEIPKDVTTRQEEIPKDVTTPQEEIPENDTTPQEEIPENVTMPQEEMQQDATTLQEETQQDVTMPQEEVPIKDGAMPEQEEVPTTAPSEKAPTVKPASAIKAALNRQTTIELEAKALEERNETEEERELRLAHNLYMRFYRSVRSKGCPPEITKMALDNKRNSGVLNGLFDEYLQSQGNWLESSLAVRLKQSSSTEALGEESMVPFKQLREQHGVSVARQMRHQKRQLQAKAKPGDLPFVMEHPDMPGCEDWELIRVWTSTSFKKRSLEEREQELKGTVDLDASQTKEIMSAFVSGPDDAGGVGISVLPKQHEATEKLEPRKPAPKQKTVDALARSKQQDIEAKQNECKTLIDNVEKSTRLSKHLRTGFVNELQAHLSKLDAHHKALSEAVDSKDDSKMQLHIDEASSAVDAMTKGAFKTIKPQLVEKPSVKAKAAPKKSAASKPVQKKSKK